MIESTRGFQRATSVERVINALHDFFKESESNDENTQYASTRDIADRSELSIYNARHILIKLEKEGVITSVKQRKSLYWNKPKPIKV
ncbi:FaeA/PapI family transcriptional regulator [Erwinia sp. SLM-02]|uniref:FaeA/PapI family transcriptional regulator n=1 Tax=Erwinia sp. SLM-02 TaxID=3020057 RepID=UPI0028D15A24|nr:FaeA/PapI family transcriptional regulator [uncultured Erwinia sp.]